MDQIVQVAGALLVLSAFTAAQLEWVGTRSIVYLVFNLVGSGILAVLALLDHQWGFLLLEGVWAVVSAWGLTHRLRVAPEGVQEGRGA